MKLLDLIPWNLQARVIQTLFVSYFGANSLIGAWIVAHHIASAGDWQDFIVKGAGLLIALIWVLKHNATAKAIVTEAGAPQLASLVDKTKHAGMPSAQFIGAMLKH